MTKKNEKAIKEAKTNLKEAQENQDIGVKFAGDYLHLQGVKFFKPRLAHIWVLKRLQRSPQCSASLYDFGICAAYSLAFEQDLVRNKVMNEITNNQIVKKAYDFIFANEITEKTVDEVIEKLIDPAFEEEEDDEKKEVAGQEPTLSGGQE